MTQKKSKSNKATDNPDLKQIIDNSTLGTVIITAPDSSILYATGGVQEKTGFSPGEAVGKKPSQLWGGDMDKAFYQKMWQIIGVQKQPFTALIKNHKKGGEPYSELAHIAPILDTAGNVKFFIEISPFNQRNDQANQNFTDIFTAAFRNQHTDEQAIVNFFLHLFSISANTNTQSLDQFLQQILVDPTQQQYHNRSEDAALIQSAQLHGSDFNKLYEKYFHHVKGYFTKRADPTLAEDLTQETFLQAFKHLPRFTISNASYITYLLRIAHSVLVNHYRLATRNPAAHDIEAIENEPASIIDHAKLWDINKLWQTIDTMPHTERQILTLRYKEDKPIKSIAHTIGKSENAIKLILSRSRKKLQQTLVTSR